MNKLLPTILISLITCQLFAQKMPDYGINKVHIYGEDRSVVLEVLPVRRQHDVIANKTYSWYGSNTVHETQGGFSGKLLNGDYREYYLNKSLKLQGSFNAGLKTGEWKAWNEEGKLTTITNWSNGEITGFFAEYDGAGKLIRQGNYSNGQLNGTVRTYAGRDSVTSIRYKNGLAQPKRKPLLQRINIFKKRAKKD